MAQKSSLSQIQSLRSLKLSSLLFTQKMLHYGIIYRVQAQLITRKAIILDGHWVSHRQVLLFHTDEELQESS